MELNGMTIGISVLIAVLVVVLLIWKNQKDKKDFERDANRPDIKPEKHDDNEST